LEDADPEEHADDGTWIIGNDSTQVPAFTDPSISFDQMLHQILRMILFP
jgi:hypothetical protein